MPDEDKSLEILIKYRAELADLKKAQAELNSYKSSVRDFQLVEKKFSNRNELDATIDVIRRRIAAQKEANEEARRGAVIAEQQKLFDQLKQESEAADKAAFSFRGLRSAVSQLGNQLLGIPGLGRSISSVLGVSIIAAIGLYVKAKRALQEWNDEMDRQLEILEKPDFMAAIQARRQVIEQAAVASAEFGYHLAHLRDPEEMFQKQLRDETSILQERTRAIQETADATFALGQEQLKQSQGIESRGLDQMLANGSINYAKYNAMKIEMDIKYLSELTQLEIKHESEKLQREKQLRDDELHLDEEALQRAQAKQPGLLSDAAKARATAVTAEAHAGELEANRSQFEKQLPELQKQQRELEKRLDEKFGDAGLLPGQRKPGTGVEGARNMVDNGIDVTGHAASMLAEYDAIVGNIGRISKALIKYRTAIPEAKITAAVTADAAQRANAAVEANANRITDRSEDISTQQRRNQILNAAGQIVSSDKASTAQTREMENLGKLGIGGGLTGQDIQNVATLERLKAMGQPINAAQQKQIQAFEQFAQQLGLNMTQIHNLMFTMAGNQSTMAQKLAALENLIKTIEHRIKDLNNSR